MLADDYQIGFMGDMPAIINGYKAHQYDYYDSLLIAKDGTGMNGKNQGIIVPNESEIKTINDLKKKTVSVPLGSSAHRMLLEILNLYGILNDVTIIHQDVTTATGLLEANQIDAFAIWEPYISFLTENDNAKLLCAGDVSNVDYLTGIIVNRDWVENNIEIKTLFLESLSKAHNYIKENPKKASKIFAKESGFSESLSFKMVQNILWDSTITDKDIAIFKENITFLEEIKEIEYFDFSEMYDKSYINN